MSDGHQPWGDTLTRRVRPIGITDPVGDSGSDGQSPGGAAVDRSTLSASIETLSPIETTATDGLGSTNRLHRGIGGFAGTLRLGVHHYESPVTLTFRDHGTARPSESDPAPPLEGPLGADRLAADRHASLSTDSSQERDRSTPETTGRHPPKQTPSTSALSQHPDQPEPMELSSGQPSTVQPFTGLGRRLVNSMQSSNPRSVTRHRPQHTAGSAISAQSVTPWPTDRSHRPMAFEISSQQLTTDRPRRRFAAVAPSADPSGEGRSDSSMQPVVRRRFHRDHGRPPVSRSTEHTEQETPVDDHSQPRTEPSRDAVDHSDRSSIAAATVRGHRPTEGYQLKQTEVTESTSPVELSTPSPSGVGTPNPVSIQPPSLTVVRRQPAAFSPSGRQNTTRSIVPHNTTTLPQHSLTASSQHDPTVSPQHSRSAVRQHRSATTNRQQSTDRHQPTVGRHQLVVTRYQPTVGSRQLRTKWQQSAADTQLSAARRHQLTVDGQQSAVGQRHVRVAGWQLQTDRQQSSVDLQQLTTERWQSGTERRQSEVDRHQPIGEQQQSQLDRAELIVNRHHPPVDGRQQETERQQLAINHQQPTVERHQPAAGRPRIRIEHQRLTVDRQRSMVEQHRPPIDRYESIGHRRQPTADSRQPTPDRHQPVVSYQQSTVERQQPTAGHQKPTAGRQQPTADGQTTIKHARRQQPPHSERRPVFPLWSPTSTDSRDPLSGRSRRSQSAEPTKPDRKRFSRPEQPSLGVPSDDIGGTDSVTEGMPMRSTSRSRRFGSDGVFVARQHAPTGSGSPQSRPTPDRHRGSRSSDLVRHVSVVGSEASTSEVSYHSHSRRSRSQRGHPTTVHSITVTRSVATPQQSTILSTVQNQQRRTDRTADETTTHHSDGRARRRFATLQRPTDAASVTPPRESSDTEVSSVPRDMATAASSGVPSESIPGESFTTLQTTEMSPRHRQQSMDTVASEASANRTSRPSEHRLQRHPQSGWETVDTGRRRDEPPLTATRGHTSTRSTVDWNVTSSQRITRLVFHGRAGSSTTANSVDHPQAGSEQPRQVPPLSATPPENVPSGSRSSRLDGDAIGPLAQSTGQPQSQSVAAPETSRPAVTVQRLSERTTATEPLLTETDPRRSDTDTTVIGWSPSLRSATPPQSAPFAQLPAGQSPVPSSPPAPAPSTTSVRLVPRMQPRLERTPVASEDESDLNTDPSAPVANHSRQDTESPDRPSTGSTDRPVSSKRRQTESPSRSLSHLKRQGSNSSVHSGRISPSPDHHRVRSLDTSRSGGHAARLASALESTSAIGVPQLPTTNSRYRSLKAVHDGPFAVDSAVNTTLTVDSPAKTMLSTAGLPAHTATPTVEPPAEIPNSTLDRTNESTATRRSIRRHSRTITFTGVVGAQTDRSSSSEPPQRLSNSTATQSPTGDDSTQHTATLDTSRSADTLDRVAAESSPVDNSNPSQPVTVRDQRRKHSQQRAGRGFPWSNATRLTDGTATENSIHHGPAPDSYQRTERRTERVATGGRGQTQSASGDDFGRRSVRWVGETSRRTTPLRSRWTPQQVSVVGGSLQHPHQSSATESIPLGATQDRAAESHSSGRLLARSQLPPTTGDELTPSRLGGRPPTVDMQSPVGDRDTSTSDMQPETADLQFSTADPDSAASGASQSEQLPPVSSTPTPDTVRSPTFLSQAPASQRSQIDQSPSSRSRQYSTGDESVLRWQSSGSFSQRTRRRQSPTGVTESNERQEPIRRLLLPSIGSTGGHLSRIRSEPSTTVSTATATVASAVESDTRTRPTADDESSSASVAVSRQRRIRDPETGTNGDDVAVLSVSETADRGRRTVTEPTDSSHPTADESNTLFAGVSRRTIHRGDLSVRRTSSEPDLQSPTVARLSVADSVDSQMSTDSPTPTSSRNLTTRANPVDSGELTATQGVPNSNPTTRDQSVDSHESSTKPRSITNNEPTARGQSVDSHEPTARNRSTDSRDSTTGRGSAPNRPRMTVERSSTATRGSRDSHESHTAERPAATQRRDRPKTGGSTGRTSRQSRSTPTERETTPVERGTIQPERETPESDPFETVERPDRQTERRNDHRSRRRTTGEQHGRDRQAGREGIDLTGSESLAYDADVDRLVETLYRRFERKLRIERERTGF